jgi:hypothetical protein
MASPYDWTVWETGIGEAPCGRGRDVVALAVVERPSEPELECC